MVSWFLTYFCFWLHFLSSTQIYPLFISLFYYTSFFLQFIYNFCFFPFFFLPTLSIFYFFLSLFHCKFLQSSAFFQPLIILSLFRFSFCFSFLSIPGLHYFVPPSVISSQVQTWHSLRPIRPTTLRRRWLHVMYKRRSQHRRINKVYVYQTVARQWISTASEIQFRFAEPRILLSHSWRAKKAFGV